MRTLLPEAASGLNARPLPSRPSIDPTGKSPNHKGGCR